MFDDFLQSYAIFRDYGLEDPLLETLRLLRHLFRWHIESEHAQRM